jgi:hypothetical protein
MNVNVCGIDLLSAIWGWMSLGCFVGETSFTVSDKNILAKTNIMLIISFLNIEILILTFL